MDIFAVVIFCVISAVLSLILKQFRPEYAIFVSLACSVLIILYLLTGISEIAEEVSSILSKTMISSDLVAVVFKCLGICILTELGSQTCKDAGENAIATKIELAGKVGLILISMPMFLELLQISLQLLNYR